MADPVTISREAAADRQRLIAAAVIAVRRLWAQIDPKDIAGSWTSGLGQASVAVVTNAQRATASIADDVVTDMLEAQGIDPATTGEIRPGSFAGVAYPWGDTAVPTLGDLMNLSVARSLDALNLLGVTSRQSLSAGLRWLDLVVPTQISDASRQATQVATVARRAVGGYYRVASFPACSRCAILSGRWYRYNAAFQRHPRCDCSQIPAHEGHLDGKVPGPDDIFASYTKAEQDAVFGKAGAKAIRDGADMTQIVNARRGMATASVGGRELQVTREGVTRRGVAGQTDLVRRNGGIRLMPEEIYRVARDRADAIRLLKAYGYIS